MVKDRQWRRCTCHSQHPPHPRPELYVLTAVHLIRPYRLCIEIASMEWPRITVLSINKPKIFLLSTRHSKYNQTTTPLIFPSHHLIISNHSIRCLQLVFSRFKWIQSNPIQSMRKSELILRVFTAVTRDSNNGRTLHILYVNMLTNTFWESWQPSF